MPLLCCTVRVGLIVWIFAFCLFYNVKNRLSSLPCTSSNCRPADVAMATKKKKLERQSYYSAQFLSNYIGNCGIFSKFLYKQQKKICSLGYLSFFFVRPIKADSNVLYCQICQPHIEGYMGPDLHHQLSKKFQ